jgi:hypothetical protein
MLRLHNWYGAAHLSDDDRPDGQTVIAAAEDRVALGDSSASIQVPVAVAALADLSPAAIKSAVG